VESQTPSGPKPPHPQQPPSKSDTVWISPRLREKLSEPDGEGPKQGPSPVIGIILAALVIGGGIGLYVSMRAGAAKEKAATAEKARVTAAAAAAESIAAVAHADSVRLAMADSTGGASARHTPSRPPAGASAAKPAPVAATRPTTSPKATAPSSTSKPAAAAGASAPTVPKVVEKGPFGLDVGTFLVEDRANSEQARLAAATGLAGKVVTRNEDGGDVYHVVLGSFATRAAAEKKAEALVAKGQVNQARPMPLAP
jgi:cell division protein FtsN